MRGILFLLFFSLPIEETWFGALGLFIAVMTFPIPHPGATFATSCTSDSLDQRHEITDLKYFLTNFIFPGLRFP